MKSGYNFPDAPAIGVEHPIGKSETVPNQALSIREIMHRSLRGALLSEVAHNRLEHGDDEDFSDEMPTEVDLSDLSEVADRVEQLRLKVDELRKAQANNSSATASESEDSNLSTPSAE